MYDIQEGDDYCAILNNSATAFNIAKNSPNCSYMMFTEQMHKQALEIKQIEDVMYSALSDGEFITYYQPKVGLTNFELVGAEALVRWKKGNTLIPPFKFIPIFEKNGFITEIDFCMLRNVCKSIQSWIAQGITPVTVSVNFSKVHLSNPKFVEQIKQTIEKYNISPQYIEIEFTETLDVENYNTLVQVNRELKKYGLKTSIDDFGAGFSSLNMLKDVPVDVVKLDKSLIDDTNSSTREKIIIQDIVKMAKTLDIEVIAEGVEELDQLLFLRNINCTQIQGYIFDKPLSLEQFEVRLKDGNYYKENPKFKGLMDANYNKMDSLSTMNFGKYTIDLETYQVLDCNASFCNIIGYSKEEIKTFTIENLILSEEFSKFENIIVPTLKINGEVCDEHKMIKKNGSKIYVMCLGMLKSLNVAEFMVSDISLNKAVERENTVLRSHFEFAQNELKNKNYAFEQIVKNLSGGIGIFAIQEDGVRTVFASNSLYNALECKRCEFDRYKDNILKMLHPNDADDFLTDIKSCLKEDKTILKRYRFKKVSNPNETKTLTLNIRSAGTNYENHPLVNIVVANYDVGDIEMELIKEIAKVSLFTEYSNFEMIPLKAEQLNIR
jgi:PAS domain S-box-containing protein